MAHRRTMRRRPDIRAGRGPLNDRLRAVRKRVRVAGGVPGGRRGSALPPSGAHGIKRYPRRSRRFRAPSSLVQLGRSCGIAVTACALRRKRLGMGFAFAKVRWSSVLAEGGKIPRCPSGARSGGGWEEEKRLIFQRRTMSCEYKASGSPLGKPSSSHPSDRNPPLFRVGKMQLRAIVCRFFERNIGCTLHWADGPGKAAGGETADDLPQLLADGIIAACTYVTEPGVDGWRKLSGILP